jgi:hypothetical protein
MIPIGPYRVLTTPEGTEFPYYIVPFDKDGQCEGPKTRDHLITNAPGCTDIFLFSHGWNNDWTAATDRYEHFIKGFMSLRSQRQLPIPKSYRPLLVGIFWPSQALTWFESEQGPDIAASDPTSQDQATSTSSQLLREIASDLRSEQRSRFYALAQADSLDHGEATELATMLAGLLGEDDEASEVGPPAPIDLLAAARAMTLAEPDYDAVGTATTIRSIQPEAAFGLGDVLKALDPRNLVKPFTVWRMKDRAGKVGAHGVANLLEALLAATGHSSTHPQARIHLLGHSFGCKVVMTATCALPSQCRQIESALLLQPAVSQYAFAPVVPKRNVPGGFIKALQRIRRPIMATFSEHDTALTAMFHLAVRRHDDLGELQMAAGGTPSHFGALGGFGPQESNAAIVPICDAPAAYNLTGTGRIIGINGTRTIGGHGDISNPSTWWAAYSLLMAHRADGTA